MKKDIQTISDTFSFSDLIPSQYGAIIMDRAFTSWPLFHDDACWKLFSLLLMRVNYKERMYESFIVHRGEFITSYQHLADALHKTRDETKYLLGKLKKINEVETSRIKNALLVRLLNYNKYQAFKACDKDNFTSPLPHLCPEVAPTLPITKESKKENKENKGINFLNKADSENHPVDNFARQEEGLKSIGSIFARQMRMSLMLSPSLEEIKDFCTQRLNRVDAKAFYNYYSSRGWKGTDGKPLRDWKQAIYRWESRQTKIAAAKALKESEGY